MNSSKTKYYYIGLIIFCLLLNCSNPITIDNSVSILINEFMVRNEPETGIFDCYGNYEDWVELFNAGRDTVSLNSFFISDKLYRPFKFALADTAIPPGGFYILWGGGNEYMAEDHIGFSFSCDKEKNEKIIIFNKNALVIDSISYLDIPDACKKGVSYGRQPDGAKLWGRQDRATPGFPNEG